MTLNESQFLPGMESMREARPHEQTEAQFHNRPNVFVHGRYERPEFAESGAPRVKAHDAQYTGFHAGTEQAAHERLQALGTPWRGTRPAFYHGVVDPAEMHNTPDPGGWEKDGQDWSVKDPGRIKDEGEDWDEGHHGKYYRNDHEDEGSTSVILPTFMHRKTGEWNAHNFLTHRQAVSDAIRRGDHVPSHVKGVYDDTGGEKGPQSVVHPHFSAPTAPNPLPGGYSKWDADLPGMSDWTMNARHQALQAKWSAEDAAEPGHLGLPMFGSSSHPPF